MALAPGPGTRKNGGFATSRHLPAVTSFSPEQLSSLLQALPDPAFVLTASGRYAAVCGGTDVRYYHDGRWLVGQRLHDVLAQDKADWFLRQVHTALRSGLLQVVEYSLAGHDLKGNTTPGPSEPIWFEGRVQSLDFPVEGEAAVLWVASNVTHRHALEQRLRLLSETDELTGLANRRQLMQTLETQHQAHQRYGTPCAVLVFDIDLFKRINDELGHHAGDEALRSAAAVCRLQTRANDLAARLGGDEFVLVLPHTTLDRAALSAERLREDMKLALASVATREPGGTISIGVSAFAPGDRQADDVLRRADRALYQAKRRGRDQVQTDTA